MSGQLVVSLRDALTAIEDDCTLAEGLALSIENAPPPEGPGGWLLRDHGVRAARLSMRLNRLSMVLDPQSPTAQVAREVWLNRYRKQAEACARLAP